MRALATSRSRAPTPTRAPKLYAVRGGGSMIELDDIAYVRSGAADLQNAVGSPSTSSAWSWSAQRERHRVPARRPPPPLPRPGRGRLRGARLRVPGGRRPPRSTRRRTSWSGRGQGRPRRPGREARERRVRRVPRLRRPVRQPPRAGRRPGPARPARRGSADRPGSPSSATSASTRRTCARPTRSGLVAVQHAGLRLDRRQGLPDADRPGPPQVRRVPGRPSRACAT